MKNFALVLSGGAAKGFAHIGVLKSLEKHGIKPSLIVGTSMGALVGGAYSSGLTIGEMENMALKVNSLGSFSLYSALFKGNLLNTNKVKKILNKAVGEVTHEQAPIKFVSVATELNTGKPHYFDNGKIFDSIMPSISIPGVFPHVKIGNNIYCDGGLVNNLPEDVAKLYMPDAVIISVDVLGDYERNYEKLKFKTVGNILNASNLMTTIITNSKPQLADLRITINQPNISQMGFNKTSVQKSINKGVTAGNKHIKQILELLKD